jgi:hypothetical protein
VCFIIYSVLIGSTLFAVANGLILLSALAGYIVLRINRRRVRARAVAAPPEQPSRGRSPDLRVAVL